jgi:hypothetical protein
MLRLVESLATKAERAKSTRVEFLPLRQAVSYRCGWCRRFASNPKGWSSYRAADVGKRGIFTGIGEVCGDPECRLSIQARYSDLDGDR